MKPRTLDEIADLCGADVEGDGSIEVAGPASLDEAEAGHVSFLAQANYVRKLDTTRATAVVVARDLAVDRDDLVLLRCDDPELAFTEVVLAFAPAIPTPAPGVHPDASVDESARVDPDASVAAQASVGPDAEIGAGAVLHPGARVGASARIGAGTVLHPNVVVYPHCVVGERCVLHAGVVIGADGLGFRFEGGAWIKTPQVGNVVVEDDVEIGANTAIDCARFGSTRIGAGTKIDNLVHLAHNVQVGRSSLILAQVGVAGSTAIGNGVVLAGQVGVAGHVNIGDGVRVAAQSGVSKDVPPGQELFGTPAGPRRETIRKKIAIDKAPAQIAELRAEFAELHAGVAELRALLQAGIEARDGDSTGATGTPMDENAPHSGGEDSPQRG